MESYRILAELSNALMFEWDISTDCFYVSTNWKSTFYATPQKENFSKNFSKIFTASPYHPDELTPYLENIQKNKCENIPTNYYHKIEIQLLTKNRNPTPNKKTNLHMVSNAPTLTLQCKWAAKQTIWHDNRY